MHVSQEPRAVPSILWATANLVRIDNTLFPVDTDRGAIEWSKLTDVWNAYFGSETGKKLEDKHLQFLCNYLFIVFILILKRFNHHLIIQLIS